MIIIEIIQLICAETRFIVYIQQITTTLSDEAFSGPVERTIVDTLSRSLRSIDTLNDELANYSDSDVIIATLSLH